MSSRRTFFQQALALAGLAAFKPLAFVPSNTNEVELLQPANDLQALASSMEELGTAANGAAAGITRLWIGKLEDFSISVQGNGEVASIAGGPFFRFEYLNSPAIVPAKDFAIQANDTAEHSALIEHIKGQSQVAICQTQKGILYAIPKS